MVSPQEKQWVSSIVRICAQDSGSFDKFPRMLMSFSRLCWACAVLAVFYSSEVRAQSPEAAPSSEKEMSELLGNIYKKAMEAFGKSDFKECIAGLEEMIAKGASGPGLESVRFTMGSAYFNLKDYGKAKSTFEAYLKDFPSGSKVVEATTAMGQCQLSLGDKTGALKTFEELTKRPGVNKDRMFLVQANLLKEMGKPDQALAMLRPVANGVLLTDESVQMASLRASLEVTHGNPEDAFKLLDALHKRFDVVDNPLQINGLAFEIGDALLNNKDYRQALRCYALVRRKEEVMALQRQKLLGLDARYKANLVAMGQAPDKVAQLQAQNADLVNQFNEGKQVLADVEKADDYMVPLRFRQARAYQELKKPWGTVVILESLLKDTVKGAAREDMIFSLCGCFGELRNTGEFNRWLDIYVKEFPQGKYVSDINFMRASQMMESNDLKGAETLFGNAIKEGKAGDKLELMMFFLGNIRFEMAAWDSAKEAYAQFIAKFPKSEKAEEAKYRSSLCNFFKGDYEKAIEELRAYAKANPESVYTPDAEYRIASCYQVAERPADVVKMCDKWMTDHSYHPLMPEVLSLQGDAYSQMNKPAEAAEAYSKGLNYKTREEIQNYLLMEANKQYQKTGQWSKSSELFRNFIEKNPNHPSVVSSLYWLGKCLVKEGKPDEAKQFLSQKIYEYIKDRDSDAVEQMLTQLAQLCAKKPRPVPVKAAAPAPADGVPAGADAAAAGGPTPNTAGGTPAANDATATSAAALAPQAPPYDPEADLDKYLDLTKVGTSELARARVYFARAELARFARKPKESGELMDKIGKEIAPRNLGASLLAQSGDRMLEKKELVKAAAFYKELMNAFPKSELVDFAYNGLGQVALLDKKYQEAVKWFDDAVDKVGASNTLKDVTLGKAKALMELGKLDEAKTLFEQVGATKEWKGQVTAESVYNLGEVAFRKEDYKTAVQFYQRVFVAYQRYPKVVGPAYLRAADCFEKIGEPDKAKAHLAEFVAKKEKYSALPEFEVASKRLESAQ